MIKGILGNIFPPSIFAGGSLRSRDKKGKGETYPAHFHQLGDHDNAEAVLLPNHPPEVVDHLLLGACRGGDTQAEAEVGEGNKGGGEKLSGRRRGRRIRRRADR